MTYRELLHLYKQGKLDMEKKKQVEAEIENRMRSVNFSMKREIYLIFLIWRMGKTALIIWMTKIKRQNGRIVKLMAT